VQAGSGPADLAARAGWRDFQSRLPASAPRPRHLPAWLPAIAASLLIATIGLSGWVWRLQGALRQPVANVPSLELISEGRGTEPVATVPLGVPLLLRLSPAERCPIYVAEVSGPGDHWTVEGLRRDARGNLTLQVAGEPGHYELRLLGCEPRREVEEYRFRIEAHDE
jgi:hypothetical protein